MKAPNSATPTTLPAWRAAFRTPDAIPDRDLSTVPSSAEVIAGTVRPIPAPLSLGPMRLAIQPDARSAGSMTAVIGKKARPVRRPAEFSVIARADYVGACLRIGDDRQRALALMQSRRTTIPTSASECVSKRLLITGRIRNPGGDKSLTAQSAGIAAPAGTAVCIGLVAGHRQAVINAEPHPRTDDLRLVHRD
jgi:hypothetical protein